MWPLHSPPALGHGAGGDRAGVGMGGEARGTCVCLGGTIALSLHAAMQGVLVGWQSFVPLALLGTRHSPSGEQKSFLISPDEYQLVRVQIRIWALVVWSVHHWHCVARPEFTGAGAAGPCLCGCHHGVSCTDRT